MKGKNLLAGLCVGVIALAGSMAVADPAKDAHKSDPSMTKPEKGEKMTPKDKDKSKDKASSTGVKAGDTAPAFTLSDLDGKVHNLSEYKGKVVVIEWFNPECPYIVKHHKHNTTFNDLHKEFGGQDVVFLAVNSSAAGKQGHGKELNQKWHKEWAMSYPVLLDESGDTGRAYGAKTTPHCFVIDKDGKIAYQGAIDNSTDAKKAGDVNYVRNAVKEVLAGQTVTEPNTKPYGCGVKYAAK